MSRTKGGNAITWRDEAAQAVPRDRKLPHRPRPGGDPRLEGLDKPASIRRGVQTTEAVGAGAMVIHCRL